MDAARSMVAREGEALSAEKEGCWTDAVERHRLTVASAQTLGSPRVMAALLHRLGRALEAAGLGRVLNSLASVEQTFRSPEAPAASFYTDAGVRDLERAAADEELVVRLLLLVGNSYLAQPQLSPALNAYEQALRRPELGQKSLLRAAVLTGIAESCRRQGATSSLLKRGWPRRKRCSSHVHRPPTWGGSCSSRRRATAPPGGLMRP